MDATIMHNQEKWKRLIEIDASDSTAQDMARETLRLETFPSSSKHLEMMDQGYYSGFCLEERQRYAAGFIQDGIHARKIGYPLTPGIVTLHQIFHSNVYRLLFSLAVVCHCGINIVEQNVKQNVLEFVLLVGFSFDIGLMWIMCSRDTQRRFRLREPWTFVRLVLVLVMSLDFVVHVLVQGLWGWSYWRYTRACMWGC